MHRLADTFQETTHRFADMVVRLFFAHCYCCCYICYSCYEHRIDHYVTISLSGHYPQYVAPRHRHTRNTPLKFGISNLGVHVPGFGYAAPQERKRNDFHIHNKSQ